MEVGAKEMEAVLRLPASARFAHFVKRVVDCEEAWGLYDDGWAIVLDDFGTQCFPLWPHKAYALLLAADSWASYAARPISLDDLTSALLPQLEAKGMSVAVFPVPTSGDDSKASRSVTITASELMAAVADEENRY